MNATDFDDLLGQPPSVSTKAKPPITPSVIGSPITVAEVSARLVEHNYDQLTDGSDDATVSAIAAARIHVAAIMARLGRALDLDSSVDRECVILYSIWELYLRVGHEGAGREYRIKARDLIIAAYGSFPEGEKPEGGNLPIGAVTRARRREWP